MTQHGRVDNAVDIIIPVHNRPRLVKLCLDSVKAQSFQPNAVIAVDDGSTDTTPAVLAEYARGWSKLRVLRSNHRGAAHARNLGLVASRAEFVAFLDSDDIWLPQKLERQIPLFAGRPDVGLVHCACFQIDDKGEPLPNTRVFAPSKRGDVFQDMVNNFYHLSGSASAIVARRELVMRVGGFDESLLHVEDKDLWLKLAHISLVDFVSEPLVGLRSHDGNRFEGRAKSDPALALLQKITVWSKWIDFAHKDTVIERLQRHTFVINKASPLKLFFHFRAYRKLRTSTLPLARQLFPTFPSYLRGLLNARRTAFKPRPQRRACCYRPQPARILMLAANMARGGTQRDRLITAHGLIQRGYDVRIANFENSAPGVPTFEEEIRELGIVPQTLTDLALPPPDSGAGWSRSDFSANLAGAPEWFLDSVCRVARAIEIHQPSIVHAWNDKVGLISALAAIGLGVPRIVVSFGSLPLTHHNVAVSPLLKPGYAAIARNPDVALLNNSAAGAAGYERWIGLRRGAIRIVRNAFSDAYQRRPRQDEVASFRAALNVTIEQPLIGAVMRLSQEKDFSLWLTTAAAIARARPDAVFVICGYGSAMEEIERQIDELGLADCVRLMKPNSDLGLVYSAFDVVLLTSIVEGLPNMLIEAQAAGCPVVATDVGGSREAILEGVTGILVKERSSHELANAVLKVLHDSAWREGARRQGPEFVGRNFSLERMMNELVEVYGPR